MTITPDQLLNPSNMEALMGLNASLDSSHDPVVKGF